ncbi:T9SS type A sorting domain-containing protein [candidate division KSB1 bacterium]|nr:T9SS type A sorting domain-containing protein [candidate division KSB1 bacterium]
MLAGELDFIDSDVPFEKTIHEPDVLCCKSILMNHFAIPHRFIAPCVRQHKICSRIWHNNNKNVSFCGGHDMLQFKKFILIACLIMAGFTFSFAFDFDSWELQRWTMQGIYAYDTYPTPYTPNPFTLSWDDAIQYPSFNDPVGNHLGSLRILADQFQLPNNFPSGTSYWLVDLISPDVTNQAKWQDITGYSFNLHQSGFTSSTGWAQILINATRKSNNQQVWLLEKDAQGQGVFHSFSSGWMTFSANLGDLSAYTINNIRIRIFGKPSASGTKQVNIDNVVPLTSSETGLVGWVKTGNCGEGGNWVKIYFESDLTPAAELESVRLDFPNSNVSVEELWSFCCQEDYPQVIDVEETADNVVEIDFANFHPGTEVCIGFDFDRQSSGTGSPLGSDYVGGVAHLTFNALPGSCENPIQVNFVESGAFTAQADFSCTPSGATPAPPSDLKAHLLSEQVHLTWTDNSDNETGFDLQFKTYPGIAPVTWRTLARLPANTISFQMDNPQLYKRYHFRVAALNDHGPSTFSNTDSIYVTMLLSWLKLSSPNGGEVWAPGSDHDITWTSCTYNKPTHVDIEYSSDGGSHWVSPPIVTNYPNTGTYRWTVPQTTGSNFIVKIKDARDGSPYDLSNKPFTIQTTNVPVLLVTPDELNFGLIETSKSFTINNGGSGTLTWSIEENPEKSWITSVDPLQGSDDAAVTVQVDRSGLAAGHYSGSLLVSSNAENKTVDIAMDVPSAQVSDTLIVENSRGLPGSTDNLVDISLKNSIAVAGLQFILSDHPDLLTATKAETTPRAAGFSLSVTAEGTVIMYHPTGQLIPPGNGPICRLFYNVDANADLGTDVSLDLSDLTVSDENAQALAVVGKNGVFSISGIKGDVNDDQNRNILDIVFMVNIILGKTTPTQEQEWAADCNNDGKINILDIILLVRWIQHPDEKMSKAAATGNAKIHYPDITLGKAEWTEIPIFVHSVQPIAGIECRIRYSTALEIKPPILSQRTQHLDLAFNDEEGELVCLIFSNKNQLIKAGEGTIFKVPVRYLKDDASPEFQLENALVVNEWGQSLPISISQGEIHNDRTIPNSYRLKQNYPNPFNPETVIEYELARESMVTLKIFDLLGKEVSTLVQEKRAAGCHTIKWNGLNQQQEKTPTGIYLLCLTVYDQNNKSFTTTRKMLKIK